MLKYGAEKNIKLFAELGYVNLWLGLRKDYLNPLHAMISVS